LDRVRIAVIGCGYIAGFYHLPALSKLPRAEVVAVVDVIEENARQAAQQHNVADVYTDYRQVLDRDDVDAVVILTRLEAHRQIVLDAASAGKHILKQKPFAVNLVEAQEMIDAVTAANVMLVPSFQHRYFPESMKAKEYLEKGTIGRLKFIRQVHPLAGLMDIGPHGIDLIQHLAGRRITKVAAFMDVYLGEPAEEPYSGLEEVLPSGTISAMNYQLEGGLLASHHLGLEIGGYDRTATELYGDEGAILLRPLMAGSRLALRVPSTSVPGDEWAFPQLEPVEYGGVVHHRIFVDDILEGTWNSATLEDGLATLKVYLAAHESARTGTIVDVPA
jgi:predicted dehydrogenase